MVEWSVLWSVWLCYEIKGFECSNNYRIPPQPYTNVRNFTTIAFNSPKMLHNTAVFLMIFVHYMASYIDTHSIGVLVFYL